MTDKQIIKQTKEYINNKFSNDFSGHDWWHIYRVWKLSKHLAKYENANNFIVEMSALLHDLDDYKLTNGKTENVKKWLNNFNIDNQTKQHIIFITENISYKGANVKNKIKSIEGKIVQDADRLDAIGAIGIARAFAYGGNHNREMHNPDIKPVMHNSFDDYKKNKSTTINHFYEKLLLLKDKMNTQKAKAIAEERTKIIEKFLTDFLNEWNNLPISQAARTTPANMPNIPK